MKGIEMLLFFVILLANGFLAYAVYISFFGN